MQRFARIDAAIAVEFIEADVALVDGRSVPGVAAIVIETTTQEDGSQTSREVERVLPLFGAADDWFPCGPSVAFGWLFDGTAFAPPPPLPPAAVSRADLVAYAASKRDAMLAGGLTVDVGAPGAPLPLPVDSTPAGRVEIFGLQKLAAQNHPLYWISDKGAPAITPAQLDKLDTVTALFALACKVAWAKAMRGIGDGSIAGFADVDAVGWPATSV